MAKNYISILFVPHYKGKHKTITISKRRFRQLAVLTSFFCVLMAAFLIHYFIINRTHLKYKRLLGETGKKDETISQYEGTIKKLKESIKHFENYAQKLNVVAGLKSPEVLKETGVGGGLDNGQEWNVGSLDQESSLASLQSLTQKTDQIEKNLTTLVDFFEDRALVLASTPTILPTKGYISSPFGYRDDPFTGKKSFHWGIDIATNYGNPVLATADGVVISTDYEKTGGKTVKLSHPITGFTTIYCHLSQFKAKPGQKVRRGEVIGLVGNTGKALGPHVHYEIKLNGKTVNPWKYILEEM